MQAACSELQRPVQACFLMKTAENSPIDHSFAEFTFLLRNWVRPLGLRNLNCPVQLMGTGMIFPWDVIRSAPLASGHLVEDLKLGLDLGDDWQSPTFFSVCKSDERFPGNSQGLGQPAPALGTGASRHDSDGGTAVAVSGDQSPKSGFTDIDARFTGPTIVLARIADFWDIYIDVFDR